MDKGYEKERFESLSIKSSIAKKFRRFSKRMGASQSMTLLLMLDFFEANGLSPKESLGPHMHTLESLIKKRINAVMAVIKDIEKNQTKPTAAMMHALFEGEKETDKKPLLTERKNTAKTLESELEQWKNKTGQSRTPES
ncbi:BfmA/BtgA family mobilization protein [Croceitalea marina]|uniref:BfmA/BtgA family mobilization protein n=1 Tax=Croceitalea marina TaxID=1775166 RepID=A0ABW5MTN9_9FLAO